MKNISKLKPLFLLFAILLFANTAKSITISSTLDAVPPVPGPGFTTATGMQNGRLNRVGGASTCSEPSDFKGIVDFATPRRYDAYTFIPTMSTCVTVTYNSTDGNGDIQLAAYTNYNPADISQGFLASSGSSTGIPGTPQSFSFNVTAGVPFTIVVVSINATAQPLGYTFDINVPVGTTFYGVTTSNQLIRFNLSTPNNVTIIGTITGLQSGENILGIDFRPVNGQLYALGSSSRLYTINLTTAAASQIGNAGAFTLNGTNFGFDFNPTVDRIRVVSNTGQNLRINPNDGSLSATDPNLNPGTPMVTAAAYTNSISGATTTTLYDIDTGNNTLNIQNPANAGTLVPVGPLGVTATGTNGFDIIARDGSAYAALTVGGVTGLYVINLQTGAATFVAVIGNGAPLRGLAAASGSGTAGATNVLDYDGDRRADFAVFRPSNNFIFVNPASATTNLNFFGFPFGQASTDIQTPGDYDGDGRTDVAVFRRTTGTFFVRRSSDNTAIGVQFGAPGDEPVARDYDGDGKTDFAVVRRANGLLTWFIRNSLNNTVTSVQFGLASDVVAPGDYDGDGKFDIAVFRGNGNQPATFFVRRSTGGFNAVQFGLGSDLVVPGDYDGDGRTDYAVVRTGSVYTWYILRSASGSVLSVQLGSKPDLTVQNDYDGDGKTDVAVYRQQNSTFYVIRSSDFGLTTRTFGQNGDYPIANYDTH